MQSPEFRAGLLAEAAMAQDAGATAAVRGRKLAEAAAPAARVTERPGEDPSPYELREWALRRAMERGIVMRPGATPKARYLLPLGDGRVVLTRQTATPRTTVITPENADEVGQGFERERREQENALLVLTYGEAECRETGILDA